VGLFSLFLLRPEPILSSLVQPVAINIAHPL